MIGPSPSLAANPRVADWVRFDGAGCVTVRTGKVELGQGILSALARIAAEELLLRLERVEVAAADTAGGPEEAPTVASQSLEHSGTAVRLAAATAREHLLALAAGRLGEDRTALEVQDGIITAAGTSRRTDYWELATGADFGRVRLDAPLVPAAEHRVVGRPGPRGDIVAIVTGTKRYVHDLAEPDTLHGRVVRPPSPAATLVGFAPEDVERELGVLAVVRERSFVGVVAESAVAARRAAERLALSCRWEERATLVPSSQHASWLTAQPGLGYRVVEGVGVPGPLPPPRESGRALAATYTRPFLMHGALGPSAAVARWSGGELAVWSHSQSVHVLRDVLARAFAVDRRAVRVRHAPGAGCYGHNGADDAAYDAALLARAVPGRSVLMTWSRADEHQWEPYGPATVIEMRAGIDGEGRILDWSHEIWSSTHFSRPSREPGGERLLARWLGGPGSPPSPAPPLLEREGSLHRNAEPIYDLPRRRIVAHQVEVPVRTSSLRSLGAYPNVFAIESFLDEIACATGSDPLELRLRHLRDERARDVLVTAAERAGWGERMLGEGRGLGLALARYKNSACAAAVVVEASVDDATAEIRIERVTIAADAGEVVDPEGLVSQLEGGFVQAASWTLLEEVTFDATRVTSVRLGDVPDPAFPAGADDRDDRARPPGRALPRRGRGDAAAHGPGDRQRGVRRGRRPPARHTVHAGAGATGRRGGCVAYATATAPGTRNRAISAAPIPAAEGIAAASCPASDQPPGHDPERDRRHGGHTVVIEVPPAPGRVTSCG